MRKLLAFLVFLVLGAVLFSWVLSNVGWREMWQAIQEFWGRKGALLLLLSFFMISLGALRWREILRSQGLSLPLSSLLKQYFGGFALSFFVPMVFFGSELFRAYALREFHEVPLQKGIVSAVTERLLEMTVFLVVLAAAVAFLLVSGSEFVPLFLWWILLAVGLLAGALLFFYLKSHRKESILRMFFPKLNGNNGFLEMEQELLRFFSFKNRAFWEGLFLSFAKAAVAFLRTLVLAGFLGKALGFFPALTVTAFTFLALLIPIPGQLGSHEALQVLAFQLLGLQGYAGAAFAFLVRAAELVVALFGMILVLRMGVALAVRLFASRVERVFSNLFGP